MSLHTKKEPTNRAILTEVKDIRVRVSVLEFRLDSLEAKMDKQFAAIDKKFEILITAIDNLTKLVMDVHDEQRAGFANYSRLDTTVEKHDKDIVLIKGHLRIA